MFRKNPKVVKGMSSAVLLSILIHAGLFLLAGMLVVFTVVKKKEVEFEPPKAVERPKMKLKKPKVKVKKTSRPKQTQHILAKVNPSKMPDIQLPEMSGLGGDGLGEGFGGGFDMMPDLEEVSVFGDGQSIGNDLAGAFYDLKRDRSGRPIPYSRDAFATTVRRFIREGFKPHVLARYYRSPRELYATTIMVPPSLSCNAPMAYGEPDVPGCLFLIHYTGQIVYPEDITFRFWGGSGDVLYVGLDSKPVLNASYWGNDAKYTSWYVNSGADHRKYRLGFQASAVGDWITLKAGEPRRMDVLMGEDPGGGFSAELLVEVKGVEYERNDRGAPILPIFKTAELTRDKMDVIYHDLVEGEACLTNGPVFCDYNAGGGIRTYTDVSTASSPGPEPVEEKIRVWTPAEGKSVEAKYVAKIADMAILENASGKQTRIPMNQLCVEDRLFIELNSPPEFEFDFAKQSRARPPIDPGPFINWAVPTLIDYVFTAKVKQVSPGSYNHELKLEYFAIGEEVDGDNYILLDRQSDAFTPSKQNERSHKFSGSPVLCYSYQDYFRNKRGEKYGGYLIIMTDSRGKIIGHNTSKDWLFDILAKLRQLPVGRHFDKSGTRVIPPRPKRMY